ncbi:MAG: hypothetical protein FWB86_04835 [Treponema sp.]|nr:hypothetical protein [Treponema sp.]MCL2251614.1 hypothetical protein [Treponema sp.]
MTRCFSTCGFCFARLIIFLFFTLLLTLFTLTPVYGGGGRDTDLSKADTLINEREYDQAILVLTDFARRNPHRFDQAQQRLRRIYQLREEFNRTADELIETLLNEPENNEKILELSRKLYSLENENSLLLANFVSRTLEIAQFNANRNSLRNILEKGRELLDKGEIIAAIQNYADGMRLMRNEFYTAGYGENIEREVRTETERVNSVITAFTQSYSQIVSLSEELNRVISSGDLNRITQLIDRMMPSVDTFINQKNNIFASLIIFERNLDIIQKNNPEMGDRNHLAFLSALIRGRTEESIQEGILGAFNVSWTNSIGVNLTAISSIIERANESALRAFNSRDFTAVTSSVNRMDSFYNLTDQFFIKHRLLFEGDPLFKDTVILFANNILTQDTKQYLELRALNEANIILSQTANTAQRQNIDRSSLNRWQQGGITTAAALTSEQQVRVNINQTRQEIENTVTRANQINLTINTYDPILHLTNAITSINSFLEVLLEEERLSVHRYYTIAHNSLQNNLVLRRNEMETGRNYLEGESRTSENGAVTVYRYPTEALEVLTSMFNSITSEIQNANTITAQYRNEPQRISANGDITNLFSNYQSSVNEMNALRIQAGTLLETARSRSSQAVAYRQDAERMYREAQTAYQRQNFETARERITRASERINSSLEIQASAALRSTWDIQLLNLGQEISRTENELIITEVRNLVNNARISYFAGNFQQAEDNLTRARNRWRVTNSTENEEVIYWLGIIRTALSARSGRVIPPTAPLYAEMSQLLSQAQRSYEEGVRSINSGQRTLGLAKFDEARQMTREVRLMFPLNQEAGILELRIEQFTDPATFNTVFEQRLRNAIAGTRQRSIESFAELQNLAELNPRYPNLRAILTQAEIDMGLRPPPPNPANIARSRELTVSANRILEGNVTTLFEAALDQINEAIALNPENNEATIVKDRLLNRLSVPTAIVLTSEDEETYQRAMRELQSGNNLVAFALVERLMENPRNRNITKLVELQRRIQSIL